MVYKKLCELSISNHELLQAVSNKYKLEQFKNRYDLKKELTDIDLKKFCDNITFLITFSDDSKYYFFSISDFLEGSLSGGGTYFKEAASHLQDLLNTVSKERSIRLLSFSDGEIADKVESVGILNKLLYTRKIKHQMHSVSVRVYHGSEPDTQVLMKLSAFSHPICDMTQIIINPTTDKADDAVEKLYKLP